MSLHQAASLLLTCLWCTIHLSEACSTKALILQDIPRDPHIIIGLLKLEPHTQFYVCCPAYFILYDTSLLSFFCIYQPTPISQLCNTKLWKTCVISRNQIQYPIHIYLHQDLKQWIAHFFSHPSDENLIDLAARSHKKRTCKIFGMYLHLVSFLDQIANPFLKLLVDDLLPFKALVLPSHA